MKLLLQARIRGWTDSLAVQPFDIPHEYASGLLASECPSRPSRLSCFFRLSRPASRVDVRIHPLLRWTHVVAQLENRPCAWHPDSRACFLVCGVLLCDLVIGDGLPAGDVAWSVCSTLLGDGWHCCTFVVPLRPAP